MDFPKQLGTLWSTTQVQLESAWRQVGLSPAEQKAQLELLMQEMEALAKRKVETETALCTVYADEVAKLKEDIQIICARLDLQGDFSVPASERTFLLRELTWLRGTYQRLDEQRVALESAAEEKLAALHAVWDEMGTKHEPGLTEVGFKLGGRREIIEARLGRAIEERAARIKEVRKLAQTMAELLDELESDNDSAFDQAVASRDERLIGISSKDLQSLERRIQELERLKEQRVTLLKSLGAQIQPLWERLGVFAAERQVFFERNSGLGQRVVDACEKELARLCELKRARMADFVDAARAQLRSRLDETRASTVERARVAGMLSEPVPDDVDQAETLLQRHEAEVARLDGILEQLQPIVKACARYLALAEERNEYEQLIQDSSRLLNRKRGGPSLREEELLRARVTKDLPRAVATINSSVADYQRNVLGGAPLILADLFGVDKPVLEVVAKMEADHEERVAREKEQKKSKAEAAVDTNNLTGKKGPVMPAARPRVPLAVAKPKN